MVRRVRSRAASVVTAIVVVAVFVVGLGVLALVVGGGVMANLNGGVSDGAPVDLRDAETRVEVVPPEGWMLSRVPWEENRVRLVTPDRVLTVELTLVPESQDAAFEALAASAVEAGAQLSVRHTEVLASGLPVVHADTGMDGLIAAVGVDGGTVTVVATTQAGADAAPYRPAIAEVLEGIGGAP